MFYNTSLHIYLIQKLILQSFFLVNTIVAFKYFSLSFVALLLGTKYQLGVANRDPGYRKYRNTEPNEGLINTGFYFTKTGIFGIFDI